MPLLTQVPLLDAGLYGIWQVNESPEYFEEQLDLFPAETEEISTLAPRKRLEWLASRNLLHQLSGRHDRGACLKDSYGKPYLEDSEWQISMSHSGDRVAVIAAPRTVGIDIQVIVPKIARIAPKFLTPLELNRIDSAHHTEVLHVLWGAKECLYKAYGKRQLDFRGHIFTEPVVYNPEGMHFGGHVDFKDYQRSFDIFAHKIDEYILVYAIILD